VTSSDSIEILRLRLDSSRNAFIHKTTPESHKTWLDEQRAKPGDYYFVIEGIQDFKVHGFVGIYNIKSDRGEWGRWVMNQASPAAIESYWLILKFGFGLGLASIYSRTDVRNTKVISIHDSLEFSKEEITNEESSGLSYKVHTLNVEDWPNFEVNLRKYLRRRAK